MLFVSLLFFILLFTITFYVPGKYILRLFSKDKQNGFDTMTLSIGIGIALFLVILYTLSWIHLVYLYYFFLAYCLFQEIRFFLKVKQTALRLYLDTNSLLILLGSLLTVSLTWMSGMLVKDGMQFYGVNAIDGIVHMSLINQFIDQFPPMTPYLAYIPFRGYHFFYDFMVANFAILFPFFSVTDLFFRFFSLFLALFYGFAGLFFARRFSFTKGGISIFLFLLYFGQGIQSLIPLLLHAPGTSLNTGVIQGLQHIFDPSVLFACAFIFLLVPLFFSIKTRKDMLIVILLLGILPMVKIYAAIMIYAGIGVVVGYSFFKKKDTKSLIVFFFSAGLSLYVYAPLNLGAGKLLFAPFLLYRHFIEGSSVLAFFQWALKYQFYAAQHNTIHIIWLYGIALLWFFLPTLGLRLLMLLRIGNFAKKTFFTSQNIFWIVACSSGFALATFFIQNVEVFNIIQFLWFSYIFLLIPTASVLSSFFSKYRIGNIVLWVCIVVLSFPDIVSLFLGYQQKPTIIASSIVKISNIVHTKVPPRDAILVLGENYTAPVISALTGRQVYKESTSLGSPVTETIGKERVQRMNTLEEGKNNCILFAHGIRSISQKENIRYILMLQSYNCKPKGQLLARVEQVSLYKL